MRSIRSVPDPAERPGVKTREPRRTVFVPARMRVGSAWSDVCIRNVSSRGMMLQSDSPPPRGSYVEVRRGTQVVIGRAVWVGGRALGVRTQDRVPIEAIVNEPRRTAAPSEGERRADRDRTAAVDAAKRAARSQRFASAFQFAVIAVAGLGAAGLAATKVYEVLSRPAIAIQAALEGEPGPQMTVAQ